MSDSFHSDRRLPAERELARPYPFGERIEHVAEWMGKQSEAAQRASARCAVGNDDQAARWYHGYAHGMAVAAEHLNHLIERSHDGV